VPGYESGWCECDMGLETPRHVLLHYPYESERKKALKESQGGSLDLNRLLDTSIETLVATKWMTQSERIPRFQLTETLLYRRDRQMERE
jgi:hypothetical protein